MTLKIAIIVSGPIRKWHSMLYSHLSVAVPQSEVAIASLPCSERRISYRLRSIETNLLHPARRLAPPLLALTQILCKLEALPEWLVQTQPDVILNLAATPVSSADIPCLAPDVGGDRTERSWCRQAIDPGHYPVITLRETGSGTVYANLRIASNSRSRLKRAVTNLYGYVIEVVTLGVIKFLANTPQQQYVEAVMYDGSWQRITGRFAMQAIRRRIFADRFEVRWRHIPVGSSSLVEDTDKMAELASVPQPAWHFYADPFLLRVKDTVRPIILVEDYSYHNKRGKKGTLRAIDLEANTSTEILKESFHISYPQVFEHEGRVYMVPETSTTRQVRLYRMEDDYTQWNEVAVLLDGVNAADATLYHDGTIWWMFAAVSMNGDHNNALHLYYADTLAGPYRSHPMNPIVSDALSARPAGRLFHLGSDLIRPSQDCGSKYGAGLNFNRVDTLTRDCYREHLWKRIGPQFGFSGLHHYHRIGDYEVIDVLRRHCRFGRTYRGGI